MGITPCWRFSVNLFETWVKSLPATSAELEDLSSVRPCWRLSAVCVPGFSTTRSSSGRCSSPWTDVTVRASSAMAVPDAGERFHEGLSVSVVLCPYFNEDACLRYGPESVTPSVRLTSSGVLVIWNHSVTSISYTHHPNDLDIYHLPFLILANYVQMLMKTFSPLCVITHNILHTLLPSPTYNLRPRSHNFTLPGNLTTLGSKNFLNRMLFANAY